MSVRSLRRGAIAASRVVAPSTVNVLSLPGTSGNYASTPDTAGNSIGGSVDLRAKLSLVDWTPASTFNSIAGKGKASDVSWRWRFYNSGELELQLSADGTSFVSYNVTMGAITDGAVIWLRSTWDSTSKAVVHYRRTGDADSWSTLGTGTINIASIFNSAAAVVVGDRGEPSGGSNPIAASNIHRFELRDGIGGTLVNNYDPSTVTILGTRNPTTLVASTGETWTMTGSAWDWATV